MALLPISSLAALHPLLLDMSAGAVSGEAEAAQLPIAHHQACAPRANKDSVSAAAAAPPAQPVTDSSHESAAMAVSCSMDLRSNLSVSHRQSQSEAMLADGGAAAPLGTPRAVVAQQAGTWSAMERQRWWQHLQVAERLCHSACGGSASPESCSTVCSAGGAT